MNSARDSIYAAHGNTDLETNSAECRDKNSNGCRGYLTKDPKACNYASFKRDCPKTCNMCDKAPMPSCVKKGSVGSCQNCRTSEQCSGSGTYCCPYMKKCISSGQKCYAPVAECNPRCPATSSPVTECKGCKTVNLMGGWDKWAPPTCGSFEGTGSCTRARACT